MAKFNISIYYFLDALFGNNSARDRLIMLISDAAPYMKAAAALLLPFYPKLVHVTCVVHGIHRVCEKIKELFPLVNKWISTIKRVDIQPFNFGFLYFNLILFICILFK